VRNKYNKVCEKHRGSYSLRSKQSNSCTGRWVEQDLIYHTVCRNSFVFWMSQHTYQSCLFRRSGTVCVCVCGTSAVN